MEKNNLKLRNEEDLLLCCTRTEFNAEIKKRILYLVNLELDWNYLLDIALLHKVKPLLYYNLNHICPEKVPENVLSELKIYFMANYLKNVLLKNELIKILKIFKYNNINAISYKGPFLAYSIYGNIGLRVFNDIDILIDKSDAILAKNLLLKNDYEIYSNIKINDSSYLKLDCEYRFLNNNKTALVEINWSFEGLFISFPTNPKFLFNEIKSLNLDGLKQLTFSNENYFLLLCIHAAKHDWKRLSWLCDISEFLKKEKELNWPEIWEKSDKLNINRIVYINIILAVDLLKLEISEDILIRSKNDKQALKLAIQIKNTMFRKNDSINIFQKFIFDLKKREKIKDGVKDCIYGLTKPTYADFHDFQIPEKLFFLYFFIRPLLLIKRYCTFSF